MVQKIFKLLPLISKGNVFASPKKPIMVVALEASKGCFNVYVEQSNDDLKFISGLSPRTAATKVTTKLLKEFAAAAATDELHRRADAGDDSVEYSKIEGVDNVLDLTVKEAREIIFGENNSLFN